MIEFKSVTKKFGEVTAIDDVSFRIEDGEFVFIIGPSGAGKTTILRLILREFLPTSGSVIFDEIESGAVPRSKAFLLRRKLGVVFQDFKLLSDRTVSENVCLPLEIIGRSEEEAHIAGREALATVGLADRADFFPSQLAGGEIQRVCIARALVSNPRVIIADEPTGNLDPATAWQIARLLKKINKSGRTVIMMTHNFEVVNSMCERVVELDKGKVISDQEKGGYKAK